MSILGSPLKNEIAENGIVSLELAYDLDQSIEILNSWDNNTNKYVGLNLAYDYVFMIFYTIFFYLIIKLIIEKSEQRIIQFMGKIVIIFIAAAGIFDAIENFFLILLFLGHYQDIFAKMAFHFASFKFLFLGLGVFYLLSVLAFKVKQHFYKSQTPIL